MSAGGHEGAPGGQVNAGVSNTTSSSTTMTSSGLGGLSMQAPAVMSRAEVVMELRLTFRPSIMGPAPVSHSITTPVVGSLVMGAPE